MGKYLNPKRWQYLHQIIFFGLLSVFLSFPFGCMVLSSNKFVETDLQPIWMHTELKPIYPPTPIFLRIDITVNGESEDKDKSDQALGFLYLMGAVLENYNSNIIMEKTEKMLGKLGYFSKSDNQSPNILQLHVITNFKIPEDLSEINKHAVTAGIIGATFTDDLEFNVSCKVPGKPEWSKKYSGKIHQSRGLKDNPSGIEIVELYNDPAFDVLLERFILNVILDLQNDKII